MVGGQTRQGGFDDMALGMFLRVSVHKSIGTASRNRSCKDALALFTGPLARVFANTEGLYSTCSQSRSNSLGNALLTLLPSVAASVASG